MIRTVATVGAVVAAASSCGGYQQVPPEPAIERAAIAVSELGKWEMSFGPLPRCRGELVSIRWDVEPLEEVQRRCGTTRSITACFTYEDNPRVPVVTLTADRVRSGEQLNVTRRHELRHWLLQCSDVDPTGDPMHFGPWWEGL